MVIECDNLDITTTYTGSYNVFENIIINFQDHLQTVFLTATIIKVYPISELAWPS